MFFELPHSSFQTINYRRGNDEIKFNNYNLQTVIGNQAIIFNLDAGIEKSFLLDIHNLMDPDHYIETGF